MKAKFNPVMLGLIASQMVFFTGPVAWAAVLPPYTPQANDNQMGALVVNDGLSYRLTGNQQFSPGETGSQPVLLGDLKKGGLINSGSEFIGAERLNPGPGNYGITIPDATTGGNITFEVYNPNNLVALDPVSTSTTVPDIVNVGDAQYINARVASLSNGTLNVDIGQQGAASSATTNGWTMAAKQTTLFNVNGTTDAATLNWNSRNRITFNAAAADPSASSQYVVSNVATYLGAFSVTTLDGVNTSFDVTDATSLKSYNNWLIEQLQSGNLSTDSYLTEFNKAFTHTDERIAYGIVADDPDDDVAQPTGERVVVNATGPYAVVNVPAAGTLEVVGANGGAIRASNSASVVNNGKVASVGSLGQESAAINLDDSTGLNSGVINGNFLNRNDGTGVGTTGYNSNAVNVNNAGDFDNAGIINLATTGNPSGDHSAGINLTGASQATNSGNINAGVNGSGANGTTSGVAVDDNSVFTNAGTGLIYIGRGPQNSLSDEVADTAMNQSETTSGISVTGNGKANNNGDIIIGSLVQNAAGMLASGGDDVSLVNNGVIAVNGRATTVPRENVGIKAVDAGMDGGIENQGTINLDGVNGTGIKVVATNGHQAAASSYGTINVAGGADPASGTRNYGVWVEGRDAGQAFATLDGPINLSGDGAIGVHARGNATVTVDSDAVPAFSQGSNQIAFFAWGPDAKINVLDTNAFDVSTTGSTLFRVEQGADFDGTGLSVTLSGQNSVGVLGTGTGGTEVNTRNSTFNVTGAGATGIMVEGGATGTIDQETVISLTGVNTVGAIVDGQKHDLAGKNSGNIQTATSLVSNAELVSSQSGLIGLIARHQATLKNTGNIDFSGENATGILVQSGAIATNSGDITVNEGGTGMLIDGSTRQTTGNNSGTMNVEGGTTTHRTTGVSATGAQAVASLSGAINLTGTGAVGAEALAGARVNLDAAAMPVFNNTDQIAYHAAGRGSMINSSSTDNTVSTARSTLYRIDDAAALNFTSPENIVLSGSGSTGVIVSGSNSTFTSGGSAFIASGEAATAVRVEGGASGTLSRGSTLTLSGNNSVGVLVNNLRTDLSNALDGTTANTTVVSEATVTSGGGNAIGYDVANGATLVNDGNVDMSGANNTGIRSRGGSTITNEGVVNVAQGTGLDISGVGTTLAKGGEIHVADGVAGLRISEGARLSLTGDDTVIATNGTAHGILLDSGAASLQARDTTINVNGSGNGIENRAETGDVSLTNVTINTVNGNGIRTAVPFSPGSTVISQVAGSGTGLNFTQASGESTSNDLILGAGYQFNVSGAGGTGINANTTGTVRTQANVNITDSNGGSALIAGAAKRVENTGTLISHSTVAPVVDLRGGTAEFINDGTIIATSPLGQAVAGSNAPDDIRLLLGDVVGDVSTGGGTDDVVWTGGTLNGSISMGDGVNNTALIDGVDLTQTRHITDGGNAGGVLTLQGITARGGSFSEDDPGKGVNLGNGWSTINLTNSQWTLTDNVQLASGTVNIAATSTLYAGNGVNPTVAGGSHNSVTVNNAGIIDLTNGTGTPGNSLVVNGDLTSQGGAIRLNATLNDGGPLANQFSDNVRITGNVRGTTLLTVSPTLASTGALTDLNHNSHIEGNEGISLAQVAGNATADSFALAGGYVAAGPWSYALYSFAPGQSDASERRVAGGDNNQFWDYRLANRYLCEGGVICPPDTPHNDPGRPAVVPQVPAYISVPVGLAYYTESILDDLHKRLGELRHQQNLPQGDRGEMFLRYTGANMTYHTSQRFRDFGYNFDMDYSALQVGGNLLRLDGEKDSLRGGVAYTRGNTRLRPNAADGYSSSTFDSDSLAIYLTWQRDNGFYLDGVLSHDWHRGETDIARQKAVAKIRAQGWTASLESGYPFELGNGVRLEPQAQLMYLHLGLDNFTDQDNLTVKYHDYNQTIGRFGARLDRSWSDEAGRQYTPYLRANLYKGWGGQAKTTIGAEGLDNLEQTFTSGKFGQMWEVGLGGTTTFRNNVSLYAEADYRKEINANGGKGWNYNAGIRWTF